MKTPTRVAPGTIWRSSPSRFATSSAKKKLMPVALPPGLARLATKPSFTGSSATPKTIGIVEVAALGRARGQGVGARGNHTHLLADQIGHELRIPILAAFRPAVCNRHVVALDITRFIESLPKGGHMGAGCSGRPDVDEPDHRRRRLLRARPERPRGRRAAEERDEVAAVLSITSSAKM